MVDFIFVLIELFSLSPTVETLWAEIDRSRRFSKAVSRFERRFQSEGALPTNQCWCQKTRVIAVSCGMKISAVHYLVLSQYTRLSDRPTKLLQQ